MSKKLKFEEAIDQIEQIIYGIESGEIGLAESLSKYEQGMKLIGHCRTILTAAEQRIAELTTDAQGNLQIKGKNDE